MDVSLFPECDYDEEINDESETEEEAERTHGGEVPLFDFGTGEFVLENGRPALVSGADALLQWIEKILKTNYGQLEIEPEYGVNTRQIMFAGNPKPYTKAEICRDIEEVLLQHEEILSVDDFAFENDAIDGILSFVVETIYGNINKEVGMRGQR